MPADPTLFRPILLALEMFQLFALIMTALVFRYLNQVRARKIVKITWIYTLIVVPGLFVVLCAIWLGILFRHLTFYLPAILNIIWGISFVKASEDAENSSLMMAGGGIVVISWILGLSVFSIDLFGGFSLSVEIIQLIVSNTVLSTIGLILVFIALYQEGGA
jgi:hypothetical protein